MSANYPSDLWQKLQDKEYRQAYTEAQTFVEVSLQICALRNARGWSLAELSKESGIPKERLEEIEQPGFEFTLEDLHGLATAFDVGLLTQFVTFSELVYRANSFNPEEFEVPSSRMTCLFSGPKDRLKDRSVSSP